MLWVDPDTDDIVAHLPGVRGAVYRQANEGAAVARGVLAAHRQEGHASITVTRGELDAFVNLEDKPSRSNNFKPAAAAIEYGAHGRRGVRALGKAFNL